VPKKVVKTLTIRVCQHLDDIPAPHLLVNVRTNEQIR
jgi:hypothetical protein